jgi:prepilin-type N-terminal cleavage/methylation domain-containing protein
MRNRRGFTLIEIMVSVTILLMIMGVSVQFLRRQTTLVAGQTSRMDALQNAGFAASQIERELREAGAGVVDAQPMIVQIANDAVTFNANMVSIDTGDVRAVYQLSDADPRAVRAMVAGEALPLANSYPARNYPDTTYLAAQGVESGAETISYWFRPDSSTTLQNRYALFRRVNALPPTLVARGIVKDTRDTLPMITYYTADTLNRLHPVTAAWLPLYHVRLHGANDDTGRTAITDSIRAVRLHFLAAAPDPRTGKDALRTVETFVRLMNSGLLRRSSCGNTPYGPSAPVALSSAAGAPVKTVTLTWSASSDDMSGERDIERYAIFRRLGTETAFADPIASIPSALKASYSFVDTQVLPGVTYFYGVAAQDCTPAMSDITVTPVGVTVNP